MHGSQSYVTCVFFQQFYSLNSLQTDEQAPLPDALDQLVHRVEAGLKVAGDFVFNCQMVSWNLNDYHS